MEPRLKRKALEEEEEETMWKWWAMYTICQRRYSIIECRYCRRALIWHRETTSVESRVTAALSSRREYVNNLMQ